MGKKIFFTGILVFAVGAFALLLSFFLPDYISSLKKESDTIELKSEEFSGVQKTPAHKIPQKIKSSTQSIDASFYINFTCPHCRAFYKNSIAPLKKEYNEDISFEIKNYPFLNTGLEMEMAKFFICAKEQKEPFFVLDYFFFGKDEISEMKSEEWIKDLELNPEKMDICFQTAEAKVLTEKKVGKEKGVRGAPTLFLEKDKISEKFEGNIEKSTLEIKILSLLSK